ncbi:hypothetical protein CLIB1423_07S05358 [[Candida] railenensis]|uniref:Uncharacterized protein n=1 Tax=[Candida] railenensis TaxID=45579 RepID=A0A9P0QQ92_9ASCO|nr:hypothetical protein CLIB1423_07S05358 [[Candida] railenensis]
MAPPKKHWATVKVPSEFLKTLPEGPGPSLKLKINIKKSAGETATTTVNNSRTESPVQATSEFGEKAIEPPTESSTSSHGLDKNGKVKHWVKRPAQFKTFSGFKVTYDKWLPEGGKKKEEKKSEVVKQVKSEA